MSKSNKEAESHFHRLEDMMRHILSVPKSEIDKPRSPMEKGTGEAQEEQAC